MATFMVVLVPRATVALGADHGGARHRHVGRRSSAPVTELRSRAVFGLRDVGFPYPGAEHPCSAASRRVAPGRRPPPSSAARASARPRCSTSSHGCSTSPRRRARRRGRCPRAPARPTGVASGSSRSGRTCSAAPSAATSATAGLTPPTPRCGRPSGRAGRRLRRRHAGRARRADRPGRHQRLRRTAPTPGDRSCAGAAARPLRVRRFLLGARPRHRCSLAGGARAVHRRLHRRGRGAAGLHHRRRRPDRRARRRSRSSASAPTTSCSRRARPTPRSSHRSCRRDAAGAASEPMSRCVVRRAAANCSLVPRTRRDAERSITAGSCTSEHDGAHGSLRRGAPPSRPRPGEGRQRLHAPGGVPTRALGELRSVARRLFRRFGPGGAYAARPRRRPGGRQREPRRARPRVLGRATDPIVSGILGRASTSPRCTTRCSTRCACTSAPPSWRGCIAYTLAGVVQRLMFRLRAEVEAKLNTLPLLRRPPVSRRPAQPGHQRPRQRRAEPPADAEPDAHVAAAIVGVVVMMFTISPLLAVVTIVTVPLSLGIMKQIGTRARPRFVAQWRHTGTLNAQIEETFTGHSIVKAFGRQRRGRGAVPGETNEELYQAPVRRPVHVEPHAAGDDVHGQRQIRARRRRRRAASHSGAITIGDVQAFIQYSRTFSMPLTQLASMMNVLQSGIASLERVIELLDPTEQVARSPGTAGGDGQPQGRVEFDDVSFSYDPDRRSSTVLSLVAEPGQTVAIVGPTGAGKTTLVNLIMRFYELDDGRSRSTASTSRRCRDTSCGSTSAWCCRTPGCSAGRSATTSRTATPTPATRRSSRRPACYVDRFVHSLPDGYATVVDDEGDNLSAGREAAAHDPRAFLADRSPSSSSTRRRSSVDTRTEVQVQVAMAGCARRGRAS